MSTKTTAPHNGGGSVQTPPQPAAKAPSEPAKPSGVQKTQSELDIPVLAVHLREGCNLFHRRVLKPGENCDTIQRTADGFWVKFQASGVDTVAFVPMTAVAFWVRG